MPNKCNNQKKLVESSNLLCIKCRVLQEEKKSNSNKKSSSEIADEFQALLKSVSALETQMIELMAKHVEEEKNKQVK
jgi:hypothetical protein